MKTFKLENEPKIESGFIVPEHYFDNFSKKVVSQLPDEKSKVIPLFQRRKNLFFAVAAVVVIALLLPIYNQFSTTSDEIDTTTLENHLTYQTDINPYELISELEETDINKIHPTTTLKEETLEDVLTANPDLERLISE
jgi:preprotein translocase subunit SecF